jgi:predicted small lipoprotein YifL
MALSVAGCGRKGPLDLPPTASNTAPVAAPADTETEAPRAPNLFNPTSGADPAPAAARGQKRPFILDPLLDERPSR